VTAWAYFDAHPWLTVLWWFVAFTVVFLALDAWRDLKLKAVASAGKVADILEPRILAAVVKALEIAESARRRGGSSS
jgi:hypothetical protein